MQTRQIVCDIAPITWWAFLLNQPNTGDRHRMKSCQWTVQSGRVHNSAVRANKHLGEKKNWILSVSLSKAFIFWILRLLFLTRSRTHLHPAINYEVSHNCTYSNCDQREQNYLDLPKADLINSIHINTKKYKFIS